MALHANEHSHETPPARIIVTDETALQKLIEVAVRKELQIIKQFLIGQIPQKEFYTPKEFAHITGMKYGLVADRCKKGKLKAQQDCPGGSWRILASEVDRLKKEAESIDTF